MAKLRTLRQGGFLYLTLNDARTRNALSPEMVEELTAAVDAGAPGANAPTKALLQDCAEAELGPILDRAARLFARQMRGEGAEGVAAFRDKRDASWVEKIDAVPGLDTEN